MTLDEPLSIHWPDFEDQLITTANRINSMRFECFSGLNQRLQPRKDTRPPGGRKRVRWIIVGPQVMRDGDLGGLGLRYKFHRYTGPH
jgi:hypothetical protein